MKDITLKSLLVLALASRIHAGGVTEISLSKEIQYQQSSATLATRLAAKDYPYSFAAEVDGDSREYTVALSPKPKITLPSSSKFKEIYRLKPALGLGSDDDDGWNFGYTDAKSFQNWGTRTKAEFDAAFPNGNYVFSVQGKLIVLSLSEGSYPPAPVAVLDGGRWQDGVYYISAKKALKISSGVYPNYGTNVNDYISLDLEDDTADKELFDDNQVAKKLIGGPKVSSSKSLSRTIPANTLKSGHTYYLGSSFGAIVSQSNVLPKCMSIAYFGTETTVKIIAE